MMRDSFVRATFALFLLTLGGCPKPPTPQPDGGAPISDDESPSVARRWNEQTLASIRRQVPKPGVHARNLFHVSVAMYDAWAAFDPVADGVFFQEKPVVADVLATRREAISFAAYRVLVDHYSVGVNVDVLRADFDALMTTLGYDATNTTVDGDSGAAIGNRVALAVLAAAAIDGSRQPTDYDDPMYAPVNAPLIVKVAGNTLADVTRWQPLALDMMIAQNGIPIPAAVQTCIGSHWGDVTPFALTRPSSLVPYHDPGPPPRLSGVGDSTMRDEVVDVLAMQAALDPADPTTIDISPGAFGNNTLGENDGMGRSVNPVTGAPYEPVVVPRADFARVLAEFWADGPKSETPPGHWNVLANYVADHPAFERRRFGTGEVVDRLEWDVTTYFALNGALHDAAITAWGVKRAYDSIRPISLVRYMATKGQSSDALGVAYDPEGLPLVPGLIELITSASTAAGERHEALAGHEGEIAVRAWRGQPSNPMTDVGGVGWILGAKWVPFQRSTFVTPAFASYVSGHSTFSRSAAIALTTLTGSELFPGGLGEFRATAHEYLQFEDGPSTDVTLRWASYFDAADQAGLSRIYGGIHFRADDRTGRRLGDRVGRDAVAKALRYILGTAR